MSDTFRAAKIIASAILLASAPIAMAIGFMHRVGLIAAYWGILNGIAGLFLLIHAWGGPNIPLWIYHKIRRLFSFVSPWPLVPSTTPQQSLNLVMIRTNDIVQARQFYEALGLEFVTEQHGTGPEHVAVTLSGTVFEIYPATNDPIFADVRLGVSVPSVDGAIKRLREIGAEIVSAPRESEWGRRAVVLDPDGRHVEIVE